MEKKRCLKTAVSVVAVLLALAPAVLRAEDARVELGTGLFGVSYVRESNGDATATWTMIGVPNPMGIVTPTVYAAIFVTPKFAIEPQLGLTYVSTSFDCDGCSGDSESVTALSGGVQGDFFFRGKETASPYAFGRGMVIYASQTDEDSITRTLVGVGAGYRIPFKKGGVLRVDARYDHMFAKGDENDRDFSPSGNFVTVTLSLGIAF